MTTTRCNAEERKAFQSLRIAGVNRCQHGEPALGTLSERLDIIIQRLGGNVRTPKPQPWERGMFPVIVERAS